MLSSTTKFEVILTTAHHATTVAATAADLPFALTNRTTLASLKTEPKLLQHVRNVLDDVDDHPTASLAKAATTRIAAAIPRDDL